ncbi:MAG TPA: hypothetical protein ENK46_10490 [Flavobacteriia bacterium]|nr:hypothetical protein [Flavobacteriia bacterium]
MNLKQRNIALIIGLAVLFWVSYQFSFSKTVALKKQYAKLKKEKELFTNISQKLEKLRVQNVYYDSILKSKKISTESSSQNNLLSTITSFADTTNIKISAFNNPHVFKKDNAVFTTFSFTVKGSFSKITRLIYQLEQNYKLGKVISVSFKKKKDFRRNTVFLECTIWLQLVEQA